MPKDVCEKTPRPAGLLCVGMAGPAMDDEIRRLLDRGVSAVILFARNIETPAQVARLCHDLKAYAGRPLLIAVDQEGGPTVRLKDGFTPLPTMRALGQTQDTGLAHRLGQVVGRELRAVGIDFALAPVLDVDTHPGNPVIAQRSLSSDPAAVAAMGGALIRGIQSQGVAACGKHFPGHGDTAQDTHHTLPRLPHTVDRLEQVELPPFRAAVQAGVAAVMSAHIVFEAIDPVYPATMSRAVLQGLLRGSLGFEGVVVSDCMEMKAIADPENRGGAGPPRRHTPASVLAGIAAGLDLAIVSHTPALSHHAIDLLEEAAATDLAMAQRIEAASKRVQRLVSCYAAGPEPDPDLSVLACHEHLEVVAAIAGEIGDPRDPTTAIGG